MSNGNTEEGVPALQKWRGGLSKGGNACRSKRMKRNGLENDRQGRDGLSWQKVPTYTKVWRWKNSLSSRNDITMVGTVRLYYHCMTY